MYSDYHFPELKSMKGSNIYALFIGSILLICMGAYIVVNFSGASENKTLSDYKKTNYILKGESLQLCIADSSEKWERGLMYIKDLPGYDGMIFFFPTSEYRTFWNKNTLVDLDIYWIQEKKIVGKTYLPSIIKSKTIVTVNSPELVDTVIEVIRK